MNAWNGNLGSYHGALLFLTSISMLSLVKNCARALSTPKAMKGPIAKKMLDKIYFGVNPKLPDQYRGQNAMNPPRAREDSYNWLRDETRKDPHVLAHLKAENDFCEAELKHLGGLRGKLYDEMLSHLRETDEEVPHRDGDFLYYSRTQQGLSYKIHCRKVEGGEEVVVLDENKLAEGEEYSDLSMYCPSPSHTKIAYTIDHSGYETYSLRVVEDVASGLESADVIEDIDGQVCNRRLAVRLPT
ncbi:prolyl oligopeptidase [Ochromonadaceae sp. CCMP2298]|nr:prolyl oligopeptidase [Ochromonadaceae sp. CCMP2298]